MEYVVYLVLLVVGVFLGKSFLTKDNDSKKEVDFKLKDGKLKQKEDELKKKADDLKKKIDNINKQMKDKTPEEIEGYWNGNE